jgi:hypothetical protein
MVISVDPDSLAADGTALLDLLTGAPPPTAEPASAHSTSAGVAANLTAQSQALYACIQNGLQKLNEGGAAHVVTAASFRETEDGNTALLGGTVSASGAISAPTSVGSVSDPVLPGIPSIPPLAPMPGEAHSTAYNTGPGSGSLRALADYWTSEAATLENIGTQTSQTGTAVNVHWSDGIQTAGANTTANGNWWIEMAADGRALASVCNDAADQQDQAVAATPTPQEFTDAKNLLAQAQAANAASGGLLTGQVSQAAALVALLQSQAQEAATTHHTASTATVNSTAGSKKTAPKIAGGTGGTGATGATGGTGAAVSTSDSASATANTSAGGVNTGATGAAQLVSNSGLTSAGTGTGTSAGASSFAQLAETMGPEMAMMGAMGPMSAMSGLGGLSRPTTPTGMGLDPGGLPGAAATAMGGDLSGGAGDTLQAGGAGVEAAGGAGAAAALPMASTSHAAPPAVPGSAMSATMSAETAGTSAASAPGGAGMSTYPPMMGGPGGGDGGAQRNMRLFPDRRMVSRPTPNTEAVFGELERERRPRGKRAAAEEGTNER